MTGNWTDIALIVLPLAYFVSAATAPLLPARGGWMLTQAGSALALGIALSRPSSRHRQPGSSPLRP